MGILKNRKCLTELDSWVSDRVFYSVQAKYIEEKLDEFYQKLIDGTIQNQKPDGHEIVNSMKREKITAPNTIQ